MYPIAPSTCLGSPQPVKFPRAKINGGYPFISSYPYLTCRPSVIIAALMPFPPGTKFGPYEVVSPLGAEGMGEAYRAKDSLRDLGTLGHWSRELDQ